MIDKTLFYLLSVKRSCLVLLQVIPDNLNIDSLKSELLTKFPFIQGIHDLHIWCLSKTKTIATCHIILKKPEDATTAHQQLKSIEIAFRKFGINHVTIQPEYEPIDYIAKTINHLPIEKDITNQTEDCPLT